MVHLLRTTFSNSHNKDFWILTSNTFHKCPQPRMVWVLTSHTLHPCPQLRMVHLLRTICCHSPNTDFEPLLRTLSIHAHSSEWYTYFEHFATIAPIRIWSLLRKLCSHAHSSEWYKYFKQFWCHSPNTNLNPYFAHFASMPTAQNGTWYTYFEQFAAIAPIRIFNHYFEHFSSMAAAF
jgi:hypothetical protein